MLFGDRDTVGVLGHTSIRHRLNGLKDIGIKLTAAEILQMKPSERPSDLKFRRQCGDIIVDPPFTKEDLDPNGKGLLGTVSLDLELGDTFCIHNNPNAHPVLRDGKREALVVDFMDPETIRQVEEQDFLCKLEPGESMTLMPDELVKGFTQRYFFMPYNLMALVVGRSKVGRFGVTTTVDAPKIDPGFAGRIILELAHHGAYPFALREGMPIAQMIFFTVEGSIGSSYDETHDSYSRNENIHYAFAPPEWQRERVVRRYGVEPIKED